MPAHAQTSTAAIVAAGRHLLEERGADALTMQDVAEAVGVRAPSLYKRVRSRSDLFRLILEDVADELTASLDAAAGSGDPVADLRAMTAAYRGFAHSNPVTYTLMFVTPDRKYSPPSVTTRLTTASISGSPAATTVANASSRTASVIGKESFSARSRSAREMSLNRL